MTWLSRLLPQTPSRQRLVTNNRTRQGQRRRRMATLENLEGRTLLSNVIVNPVVGGVLTIIGDAHNNTFTINEDGGNQVTVTGTKPGTTINFLPFTPTSSVTQSGVTSIVVNLPGGGGVADNVSLTEVLMAGKTSSGISTVTINTTGGTATTAAVGLNLTVTGVKNTGNFILNDGTLSPFASGGKLTAAVTGSQFANMNITGTGCCLQSVELDNDIVSGSVSVSEGWHAGNFIGLDSAATTHDKFGSTTLLQGVGVPVPVPGQDNSGASDKVVVTDADLKDLTITQPKAGSASNDQIFVGITGQGGALSDVQVALTSFGVKATQYGGANDLIEIVSITTTLPAKFPNVPLLGGPDNIITWQGDGTNDKTIVDSSKVYGNIKSHQGDGAGDEVDYFGDSAGFSLIVPPFIVDLKGNAVIDQGNGSHDIARLDCGQIEHVGARNSFNNVTITQGDSNLPVGCDPIPGDLVSVNCTDIASDLTIEQGAGVNGSSLGNNEVDIATTSSVTVGGATNITEDGPNNGNNNINLGGFNAPNNAAIPGQSPDFETLYLDVDTGDGGGATVQVFNTVVDVGAVGNPAEDDLFLYNITGDGDGNTVTIDVFSSATVSVEPFDATNPLEVEGFVVTVV